MERIATCQTTIGITMGDAAGIGAELVAKAAAHGVFADDTRTVIVGDERQLKRGMEVIGASFSYHYVTSIHAAMEQNGLILMDTGKLDAYRYPYGIENADLGLDAGSNIRTCVDACRQGFFDAICFAPNNKTALKKAGFRINGAIDLLSSFFEYEGYRSELSVLDNIWTVRVTSHVPLCSVGSLLSEEKILEASHLLNKSMRDAGCGMPRIAVAGLNPHNGEGGTCGREEVDIISPAVKRGGSEGLLLTGPLPADTLFYHLFRGDYDGAVTMYHDQGQIAMKLRGFGKGATVFGGLPAPVTTCSHGSAFDIAGTGTADSGSWEYAYLLAKTMGEAVCQKRFCKKGDQII